MALSDFTEEFLPIQELNQGPGCQDASPGRTLLTVFCSDTRVSNRSSCDFAVLREFRFEIQLLSFACKQIWLNFSIVISAKCVLIDQILLKILTFLKIKLILPTAIIELPKLMGYDNFVVLVEVAFQTFYLPKCEKPCCSTDSHFTRLGERNDKIKIFGPLQR